MPRHVAERAVPAPPVDADHVPRAPQPIVPASVAGVLVLLCAAAVVAIAPPWPDAAATAVARGVTGAAFVLVVPGSLVVHRLRLSPLVRAAVTPLVGLAALVMTATVAALTGWWYPSTFVVGGALAALVTTASGLTLGIPRPRAAQRRGTWSWRSIVLAVGLLGCALLWATALPGVARAAPSVLGPLVVGPASLPASILGLAVVLALALRWRCTPAAVGCVVLAVLVLHATAPVVDAAPVPSSAYKHLGVVALLAHHHRVLSGTDIYMNWPGMFAAVAWFDDATGTSALGLARWFPVGVQLLLALQTAALARALGARRAGCAAAAVLVVAFNWVGQDYFSPQALAVCLAAGVLVLVVSGGRRRGHALLALLLLVAIVPTHQLTPFWLVPLVAVLAVLRRAPWWLPVVMGVLEGAFVALHYGDVAHYGLFSGFDLFANASSDVPQAGALGRQVGGWFAKGAALLLWGSTASVLAARLRRQGLRRAWRSRSTAVPAVLAFTSFILLGGQNYGGEAILRVTLYSTIGCSAVLGPVLAHACARSGWRFAVALCWLLTLVAVCAESAYGQWSLDLILPEDAVAAQWLATQAPADATVVPVIDDWPGRLFADYRRFSTTGSIGGRRADATIDEALLQPSSPHAGGPARVSEAQLVGDITAERPRPTYVVFTASMRAWDQYYATFARGSYEQLLRSLAGDDDWRLVRHHGDLWIYQYVAPGWPQR